MNIQSPKSIRNLKPIEVLAGLDSYSFDQKLGWARKRHLKSFGNWIGFIAMFEIN